LAAIIASVEAALSSVLLGFGLVYFARTDSPGNRLGNPFADLQIQGSALIAGLGFILCISFVVAARGIWKDRAYGAIVMISLNGIGVFLSFSQVTSSPLALSIVVVGGVGFVAGCIADRPHPSLEDVSPQ
jgi:hypothetical protein